ncbi:uncharacterized protein METZ01_LOCUS84571 [marine metagenome]|uniref:Uncharacterized protein n=1 Tax=marine metagenome TaxID=408172 RepID=A0A381UWH4_9ZZZZ
MSWEISELTMIRPRGMDTRPSCPTCGHRFSSEYEPRYAGRCIGCEGDDRMKFILSDEVRKGDIVTNREGSGWVISPFAKEIEEEHGVTGISNANYDYAAEVEFPTAARKGDPTLEKPFTGRMGIRGRYSKYHTESDVGR